MISISLQFEFKAIPAQQATAWWFEPCGALEWMREVERWSIPLHEIDVCSFPGYGVLIVPKCLLNGATQPHAIGMYLFARNWYVPIHSREKHGLDGTKLESWLQSNGALRVYHPQHGWLEAEEPGLTPLTRWIMPPCITHHRWTLADPGSFLNQRILELRPQAVLDIEKLFTGDKDNDIGSRSQLLSDLPPSENEPSQPTNIQPVAKSKQWLAQKMRDWLDRRNRKSAGDVSKGTYPGKPPGDSSGRSAGRSLGGSAQGASWFELGLQALGAWANRQLEEKQRDIEELRNRATQRLLDMLEKNPEEGLKYALPLAQNDSSRGLAPPATVLPPNSSIDFDLNRLNRSGAADSWNLSEEHRQRLLKSYHDLAKREEQLGRVRRAAYIYSILLGDHRAAAAALRRGGYFQEAAVLFRDRVKSPIEAAMCLEEGGLLAEAIDHYLAMGNFEKVGQLYAQLDQPEQANKYWNKSIDTYLQHGKPLEACRVAEIRLKDIERAILIAEQGAAMQDQRFRCWERLCRILGQEGQHERMQRYLTKWSERPDKSMVEDLLNLCVNLPSGYPDRRSTEFIKDTAMRIVSEQLPSASTREAVMMTEQIAKLDMFDSLLRRDCQFIASNHTPPAPPALGSKTRELIISSKNDSRIKCTATYRLLPNGRQLKLACRVSSGILAAEITDRGMHFHHFHWRGAMRQSTRIPHLFTHDTAWHLSEGCEEEAILAIGDSTSQSYAWEFAASDSMWRPLLLRVLRPSSQQMLLGCVRAFEHDLMFVYCDLRQRVIGIASRWLSEGVRETTEEIPFPLLSTISPMHFLGQPDWLAFGSGSELMTFDRENGFLSLPNSKPILGIAGPASSTKKRIVVSHELGATLYELDDRMQLVDSHSLGDGLPAPLMCINSAGQVILGTPDEFEVYDTKNRYPTLIARHKPAASSDHAGWLAVTATRLANEFAAIRIDGMVCFFQIS